MRPRWHGIRHGPGASLVAPRGGSPALTWEVQDGIAVVVLDDKDHPVNTISRAVKDEFRACFEALANDANVKAVAFFSGKPDNFIAGADIEEFVQLTSAAEAERLSADGQEMLDRVTRLPKPIAVGIHGAGLGGGLEFALACHYRVATDHPKTQIGLPQGQLAGLEAVEYGLRHGMAEGLQREAQLFGQLAVTDVSRKLVQIFFATNQLKKDLGVANAPPPVPVQRLGIIGSGFMGAGIAGTAVAQAQVDVRMKDADVGRVAQGILAARAIIDDRLKRRRITKYEYAPQVALLSGDDTYAGFGRAELTIEAVFEELGVKQQVLREVEAVLPPTGVFASNTSTIPITRIAEAAHAPERVIGMHFFSPVAKMPLLEVIPGARTEPQTVSTAVAFGRRIGKTVIVVKDSPGLWVNRILTPYPT